MRLITDAQEIGEIQRLLPSSLLRLDVRWEDVLELKYSFRSDLIYMDVINPGNVARWPSILKKMGEVECFLFNHISLLRGEVTDNCSVAFQLSREDRSDEILTKLTSYDSDRNEMMSVFYLTGMFGVVSPSKDWLLFAEPDGRAIFFSKTEMKYDALQSLWWVDKIVGN